MTQPQPQTQWPPSDVAADGMRHLDYAAPTTPAPRPTRRGVIAGRVWSRAVAFLIGSAVVTASILVPNAIGLFRPAAERPQRELWAGEAFTSLVAAGGFGGLGALLVAAALLRPVFPPYRKRHRYGIQLAAAAGSLHPLLIFVTVLCLRREPVLMLILPIVFFAYPPAAAFYLGRRSR